VGLRCGLVLRDGLEGLQVVGDEVDDLLRDVEFELVVALPRYVWFGPDGGLARDGGLRLDGGLLHDGGLRLVVVRPHDVVEVDEAPLVVELHV